MSDQNPPDSNDAAETPEFLRSRPGQQDSFQNSGNSASSNSTSEENISTAAPELSGIAASDGPDSPPGEANPSRWAERRQAAYASLDAALERFIQETTQTLAELKRQTETEAAQMSSQLLANRASLRQELQDLQQERTQLQQQIAESRRTVQEETDRLAQVRAEREGVALEITRLQSQLDAAQAGQTVSPAPVEILPPSVGVEAPLPVEEPAPLVAQAVAPVGVEEEVAAAPAPPAPAIADSASPVSLPPDIFTEVVTPRIPGGSPVVPVTPTVVAPIPGPVPEPVRHAITSSTFAYLQELLLGEPPPMPLVEAAPSPAPSAPQAALPPVVERERAAPTGPLRLGGPTNQEQTTGLPPRRGQTAQLGARPPRRRVTTGPLGPLPGQEMATPAPLPVAVPPAVSPVPEVESSESRLRRAQSPGESEQQQKVVLRELGLQLGLTDPITPPALHSMSFAAGYTPPSGVLSLAAMLDEINANVSAILPPPPVIAPTVPGGRGVRKIVEPPPPVSPDTNLDDYSIEEEPPSPTLQELLEAGEQELAAINEDPTPPENPTPFIGKIGADHPVHFQPGPTITPKPEPLAMLNREIDTEDQKTQSLQIRPRLDRADPPLPQTREFRPLVRPQRSRETQDLNLPLSFNFPPLTNPADTRQTRVIITNLQGRYDLPVLERILRGLVGVAQVVVQDFNRQTLSLEIVHRANLNLIAQFIMMPDLPLRLVNDDRGTLTFGLETQ